MKRLTLLMILSILLVPQLFSNPVFINEFMSSNSSFIKDEDGANSDWIELYNSSETDISLLGYGLSDNLSTPFKWIFPNVAISARSYLIVWASNKNRVNPAAPLHTNFAISAGGEDLLLTDPKGNITDQIPPKAVQADLSYGRYPDGTANFFFFENPSPNQTNNPGITEVLNPPTVNVPGGFYSSDQTIVLSHPDPKATIYYTLDGSEPDPLHISPEPMEYKNQYPKNPGDPFGPLLQMEGSKTYIYTNPIAIADRSNEEYSLAGINTTTNNSWFLPRSNIFKGTVLRAKAYKENAMSSLTQTNTYFISPDIGSRYHLPIVSISTDKENLFSHQNGIYVPGITFDNWRTEKPNEPIDEGRPANYHQKWERKAFIEWFGPAYNRDFAKHIDIQIHGGWSSAFRIKSLRLYAGNYSDGNSMDYPFFDNLKDISKQPIHAFKTMILRNSGNDAYSTYFRDALLQDLVSDLSFDTQAYRPAVHFINGEYWGLINVRERFDEYYLASHYGVNPQDAVILELDGSVVVGQASDAQGYFDLKQYITNNGCSESVHYQYIKDRIDIENFRDYNISQIFFANGDWPGNNNT